MDQPQRAKLGGTLGNLRRLARLELLQRNSQRLKRVNKSGARTSHPTPPKDDLPA